MAVPDAAADAGFADGEVSDADLLLRPTQCAICQVVGNSDVLYESTLTRAAFTASTFSARRLPDLIHYRMVRCRSCGLVRSDPVLDAESLAQLYRVSSFDYGSELDGLRRTYGRAIDELARVTELPGRLLDIGAGNGFVLEVAEEHGWREAWGIEPSEHARHHARPHLRERIKPDVMRPGLFAPASFEGITLFQVLDHLSDPAAVLTECRELLVPGGAILAFNHNISSWSARLLGEHSPIIDVEHTYLYSPKTMRAIFEKIGFEILSLKPVRNTYSLSYLAQLLPLPRQAKQKLLGALARSRVGSSTWTVPLGNLCLIARRPG